MLRKYVIYNRVKFERTKFENELKLRVLKEKCKIWKNLKFWGKMCDFQKLNFAVFLYYLYEFYFFIEGGGLITTFFSYRHSYGMKFLPNTKDRFTKYAYAFLCDVYGNYIIRIYKRQVLLKENFEHNKTACKMYDVAPITQLRVCVIK